MLDKRQKTPHCNALFLTVAATVATIHLYPKLPQPPCRPDPRWYPLESRCQGKASSGRLLLGVRLFMNKPTSERAAAVGGVDHLKVVAEKRMDVSW